MAVRVVVLLVAALLVAASVDAEALDTTTEKPESFSLKIILHNLATRDVSFKLANLGKHATEVVVGKKDQWSAIGPVTVSLKYPVMRLLVSVDTKSGTPKTKTLQLDLVRRFKKDLKGKKFLVLTAVESWKSQFLFIKLGTEILLTLKL